MNRLGLALAAFVALGALAWATLDDPRVRAACLIVLTMFAVKTWLRRHEPAAGSGNAGSGNDEPE